MLLFFFPVGFVLVIAAGVGIGDECLGLLPGVPSILGTRHTTTKIYEYIYIIPGIYYIYWYKLLIASAWQRMLFDI